MNEEGVNPARDGRLYRWREDLNIADYIHAIYEVTILGDAEAAATEMAMVLSAGDQQADELNGAVALISNCAMVIRVSELSVQIPEMPAEAASEALDVPVTKSEAKSLTIELAVPMQFFARKPAQLFNILVGAVFRAEQLISFKLVSAKLPQDFGPGSGFGLAGIRQLAQQSGSPLRCCTMSTPALVDTPATVQRGFDALVDGMHIIKDNVLAVFSTFAEFKQHLRSMISARDTARVETGEQKLYFANLICEPWELAQRWELCCYMGVDGVFVSPWLQGWGTLSYLARQRKMPILAEHIPSGLVDRGREGSLDDSVLIHWLQVLGSDFYLTDERAIKLRLPDKTRNDQRDMPSAFDQSLLSLEGLVPVLRGQNSLDTLARFRKLIGSNDFMLIVDA